MFETKYPNRINGTTITNFPVWMVLKFFLKKGTKNIAITGKKTANCNIKKPLSNLFIL